MLVAVAGGKLQGVEATYLAGKAGWRTRLLDRDTQAPASGLCDELIACDLHDLDQVRQAIRNTDLIIPAIEDAEALSVLGRAAEQENLPLAFDASAYAISSSKAESNRLFQSLGLAMPPSWPGCGFPVLLKPDSASGSQGVRLVHDYSELAALLQKNPDQVVQGYRPGPSYSIEILGVGGCYRAMQVTDLHMDQHFDCKRVSAPTLLPTEIVEEIEEMAINITKRIGLNGIMDLEVIRSGEELLALEIDARLPSQTPTVVYWSSGLNLVKALGQTALNHSLPGQASPAAKTAVLYEHIQVTTGHLRVLGEHIMAQAGPLHIAPGFLGSDEAITNHAAGRNDWVATMIYRAENMTDVWARRNMALRGICRKFQLELEDLEP